MVLIGMMDGMIIAGVFVSIVQIIRESMQVVMLYERMWFGGLLMANVIRKGQRSTIGMASLMMIGLRI